MAVANDVSNRVCLIQQEQQIRGVGFLLGVFQGRAFVVTCAGTIPNREIAMMSRVFFWRLQATASADPGLFFFRNDRLNYSIIAIEQNVLFKNISCSALFETRANQLFYLHYSAGDGRNLGELELRDMTHEEDGKLRYGIASGQLPPLLGGAISSMGEIVALRNTAAPDPSAASSSTNTTDETGVQVGRIIMDLWSESQLAIVQTSPPVPQSECDDFMLMLNESAGRATMREELHDVFLSVMRQACKRMAEQAQRGALPDLFRSDLFVHFKGFAYHYGSFEREYILEVLVEIIKASKEDAVVEHMRSLKEALRRGFREKRKDLLWEVWTSKIVRAFGHAINKVSENRVARSREIEQLILEYPKEIISNWPPLFEQLLRSLEQSRCGIRSVECLDKILELIRNNNNELALAVLKKIPNENLIQIAQQGETALQTVKYVCWHAQKLYRGEDIIEISTAQEGTQVGGVYNTDRLISIVQAAAGVVQEPSRLFSYLSEQADLYQKFVRSSALRVIQATVQSSNFDLLNRRGLLEEELIQQALLFNEQNPHKREGVVRLRAALDAPRLPTIAYTSTISLLPTASPGLPPASSLPRLPSAAPAPAPTSLGTLPSENSPFTLPFMLPSASPQSTQPSAAPAPMPPPTNPPPAENSQGALRSENSLNTQPSTLPAPMPPPTNPPLSVNPVSMLLSANPVPIQPSSIILPPAPALANSSTGGEPISQGNSPLTDEDKEWIEALLNECYNGFKKYWGCFQKKRFEDLARDKQFPKEILARFFGDLVFSLRGIVEKACRKHEKEGYQSLIWEGGYYTNLVCLDKEDLSKFCAVMESITKGLVDQVRRRTFAVRSKEAVSELMGDRLYTPPSVNYTEGTFFKTLLEAQKMAFRLDKQLRNPSEMAQNLREILIEYIKKIDDPDFRLEANKEMSWSIKGREWIWIEKLLDESSDGFKKYWNRFQNKRFEDLARDRQFPKEMLAQFFDEIVFGLRGIAEKACRKCTEAPCSICSDGYATETNPSCRYNKDLSKFCAITESITKGLVDQVRMRAFTVTSKEAASELMGDKWYIHFPLAKDHYPEWKGGEKDKVPIIKEYTEGTFFKKLLEAQKMAFRLEAELTNPSETAQNLWEVLIEHIKKIDDPSFRFEAIIEMLRSICYHPEAELIALLAETDCNLRPGEALHILKGLVEALDDPESDDSLKEDILKILKKMPKERIKGGLGVGYDLVLRIWQETKREDLEEMLLP